MAMRKGLTGADPGFVQVGTAEAGVAELGGQGQVIECVIGDEAGIDAPGWW
jgi:hypothetical protein